MRHSARSRAQVRQITTGTVCHLEATMIGNALSVTEFDWEAARSNIQAVPLGALRAAPATSGSA